MGSANVDDARKRLKTAAESELHRRSTLFDEISLILRSSSLIVVQRRTSSRFSLVIDNGNLSVVLSPPELLERIHKRVSLP